MIDSHNNGWIKIHRKLKDKAFFRKDSEKVHLWILLLMKANYSKNREEILGGKPYLCKPGEFTTGRRQLSEESGISESKIERILTYFEKIEQQIEQQKTSRNRLIIIKNWNQYQCCEQQSEQQVNNNRTTSEQQVNTLKEIKKKRTLRKKENILSCNGIPYKEIIDHLNEKTNSSYKFTTKKTRSLINARWQEGFRLEDFIYVIDIKTVDWLNDSDNEKYLRPETLFGIKFEGYRNQKRKLTKEEKDEQIKQQCIEEYYKKHPEERNKL